MLKEHILHAVREPWVFAHFILTTTYMIGIMIYPPLPHFTGGKLKLREVIYLVWSLPPPLSGQAETGDCSL